jgi:hypothetical protein
MNYWSFLATLRRYKRVWCLALKNTNLRKTSSSLQEEKGEENEKARDIEGLGVLCRCVGDRIVLCE